MKKFALLLILVIFASGCLIKQPAVVTFEIDRTVVKAGGTFHIIVTINNTGKVAFIGADLAINNPDFKILQNPKFPSPLKVGEKVELVWIVKAPDKPGVYTIGVPLELIDELHRTWKGFYHEFTITVVKEETETKMTPGELSMNIKLPSTVSGGKIFNITVELKNSGMTPIEIGEVSVNLLDGLKIINRNRIPEKIYGGQSYKIVYQIDAPYRYVSGYVTVIVNYFENGNEKKEIVSRYIEITWAPWFANNETLRKAYGDKYYWIENKYLVDGYWIERFNSTPYANVSILRNYALPLVLKSKSEVEAAEKIYSWILTHYKFGDTTASIDPQKILQQNKISYAEGQLLFTAMMKSINVPSRIVSLYNGTDCIINPLSEFYSGGRWYVVDFKHGFIGTRDEYIATPYFPRVYQLLTQGNFKLVAQAPEELKGHEHIDVGPDYLANLKDKLMTQVEKKLNPMLKTKLTLMLNRMNENEQIFALFIFASAPEKELNEMLLKYNYKDIERSMTALYEFYKDKPWPDNFRKYWYILRGVYK
ncbi:transglutaminase-like domain-containing protein [Thermococcus sp. SY098]|uniref:transglutaminase-like domain-containing protein n=1 Tax=Thermococcus sp. SY098 TaxID=3111325 RepID=UPI002D774595|nr:transglutaminase-like domain-containing protein [Thermococcus sp. SY098]WRS53342.1 transglutaminase-like domain-containing protein [Thermococcus sp. SY098]